MEQFTNGTFDLPGDLLVVVHQASIGALVWLYLALVTVFPSGGFARGRWGQVGRLGLAAGTIATAASSVMPMINAEVTGHASTIPVPNPIAVLPDLAIWRLFTPETAGTPQMILILVAAIGLVVRARRSTGIERLQLRWFTAAIGAVVLAVIAGFVLWAVFPSASESGLAWVPASVAFPMVPLAVGIAVLRYRLYEIDRVISRTVGWALVTSVLLAVFGACVIGFQTLLAGAGRDETLAVAGSTLITFAIFQPVRRRFQALVDHRFNRARYDAERMTTALRERLRDQIDLDSLSAEVTAVVDVALRPTVLGMWIRGGRIR
jgi:hypothetical protein